MILYHNIYKLNICEWSDNDNNPLCKKGCMERLEYSYTSTRELSVPRKTKFGETGGANQEYMLQIMVRL